MLREVVSNFILTATRFQKSAFKPRQRPPFLRREI
jgi:hypothetical protein